MKKENKATQIFCDAQSGLCKDSEKIWGITSKGSDGKRKLHRLTFSKSLAELITQKNKGYEMSRFEYKIGKQIEPGQSSSTGIYGLISKESGIALRISLIKELSAIHYDENSRIIKECYLREI